MPEILERLNQAISGTGEVSEEATKKAQLFVRAFKDSSDELEEAASLKERNGVLNARQQALMGDDSPAQARERLGRQREAASELSGALYSLGTKAESGEPMSGEERNARKWEALLAGGMGGRRRRMEAFSSGGIFDEGDGADPSIDTAFGEISGEGALRALGGIGRFGQAAPRMLFQGRMIANALD